MKQLKIENFKALRKNIDILRHDLTEAGQDNCADYLLGQHKMLELTIDPCLHWDRNTVDMEKLKECYDDQMLNLVGTTEINHSDMMSKVCKGTATSDEAQALGIHTIMERLNDISEHGLTEDNNRLEEFDMNAILKRTAYLHNSVEALNADKGFIRSQIKGYDKDRDPREFVNGQLAVYDKVLAGEYNRPDSSLFDRDVALEECSNVYFVKDSWPIPHPSDAFLLGQRTALEEILNKDGRYMKPNLELDHLIQSHRLDALGDILPHMSDKGITDVLQSLPDCTIEYHSADIEDLGTALDGLSTEKGLEL